MKDKSETLGKRTFLHPITKIQQQGSRSRVNRLRVSPMQPLRNRWLTLLCFFFVFHCLNVQVAAQTQTWNLNTGGNGKWSVRSVGSQEWKQATVPGTNESNLAGDGFSFSEVAEYRLEIDLNRLPDFRKEGGRRTFLNFAAVATECRVFVDDSNSENLIGYHLGGWTPFRVELSNWIGKAGGKLVVRIVVDELEGHNTQGFLPIVAPHFGGIWQEVTLEQSATLSIDPLATGVVGSVREEVPCWFIDSTLHVSESAELDSLRLVGKYRLAGEDQWNKLVDSIPLQAQNGKLVARQLVPFPDAKRWSPEEPLLYEFQLDLEQKVVNEWVVLDGYRTRTGFREVVADDHQLMLNERPLVIRGLLNWGYQPDSLGPTRELEDMLKELEVAKSLGFNLMKFCLWIPPQQYLDLCDELGMLVWIEYPTWHPDLSPKFRDELLREYREFYSVDREHTSVILRSLTCETGVSADLGVLQDLYNAAKEMIPGALVEDDSSWIEWNRIHDFYDDHPYGNNDSWPSELKSLTDYIGERKAKPLMLGEAIAADTWFSPTQTELAAASTRFGTPGFAEANSFWLANIRERDSSISKEDLENDSKRYALLMRKYQIERYRSQVRSGGYVVSVIRDFPLAGMGLIDYRGESKWSREDWSWHGNYQLVLRTPDDRRSCVAGEHLPTDLLLLNDGAKPLEHVKVELTWRLGDKKNHHHSTIKSLAVGATWSLASSIDGVSILVPETSQPVPLQVEARLTQRKEGTTEWNRLSQNSWQLWVFPRPSKTECFQKAPSWDLDSVYPCEERSQEIDSKLDEKRVGSKNRVRLTREIDSETLSHLQRGGQVLLVPNGKPTSFATQSHWFLRGGPVVWDHAIGNSMPRQSWVELQHLDLSSHVVWNRPLLGQVKPVLSLWDNHDIKEVRNHLLLFEMAVGSGRLVVAPILDGSKETPVQRYLFDECIRYLAAAKEVEDLGIAEENLTRLKSELTGMTFDLSKQAWSFSPDEEQSGFQEEWFRKDLDRGDWKPIKIDQHWEAQGFSQLDGWAWYHTEWTVPENWDSNSCYLCFTGVDDHYRAFVNGIEIGKGGDIATQQTAFEERASHRVDGPLRPGQKLQIVIAVYDWYGAGGIFRPISISTSPLNEKRPWLVQD